jgi:hypothetical protein
MVVRKEGSMTARLKVSTWSDGFHRYTVATSSRAKALEVWGFRRDLFKTGDAQQIAAGDDYQEALAHPGVSVERGLSGGGAGPYAGADGRLTSPLPGGERAG